MNIHKYDSKCALKSKTLYMVSIDLTTVNPVHSLAFIVIIACRSYKLNITDICSGPTSSSVEI